MSIDKSLVTRGKLKRQRGVLTRAERVERLKEEERWEEGRSVFGLPKVRTLVVSRKLGKAAAAEAAGEEAAEGGGAVAGAGGVAKAGS